MAEEIDIRKQSENRIAKNKNEYVRTTLLSNSLWLVKRGFDSLKN